MIFLLVLGCAGDDGPKDGDTGPAGAGSYPTDSSADGIAAYLASGAYREAPWISETDTPRERTSDVSPHGRVQVWGNDVLVASQQAGNGELGGTPHDVGSMAVKEMVDDADALVGVAVMLKLDSDWVYYCEGPADRCGVTGSTPVWGTGLDTECGFCHGGIIFNAF